MKLEQYFKSVIDQDTAPVVLCSMDHIIVYMNPAAIEKYSRYGGEELVGKSLMQCHSAESRHKIENVLDWFRKNTDNNIVYEFRNERENKDVYMIALRDQSGNLIGYYEKHEFRNTETGKFYDFE